MKIKKISEEGLVFDNGILIKSYHEPDCCEHHWADFSVVKSYNVNSKTGKAIEIKNVEFDDNVEKIIELVDGMGFCLVAKDGSKYFVPCYAENNGYYSDKLELIITGLGKEKVINITKYQKDFYDDDAFWRLGGKQ